MAGDSAEGIRTLPVLLGPSPAAWIASLLLGLGGAAASVAMLEYGSSAILLVWALVLTLAPLAVRWVQITHPALCPRRMPTLSALSRPAHRPLQLLSGDLALGESGEDRVRSQSKELSELIEQTKYYLLGAMSIVALSSVGTP